MILYGCGVREIVVLIMEVNNLAYEVTDMESGATWWLNL